MSALARRRTHLNLLVVLALALVTRTASGALVARWTAPSGPINDPITTWIDSVSGIPFSAPGLGTTPAILRNVSFPGSTVISALHFTGPAACNKMFMVPGDNPLAGKSAITFSIVFSTNTGNNGPPPAQWHARGHIISNDACGYCGDWGMSMGGGYLATGIGRSGSGEMEFRSTDIPAYRVDDTAVHVASYSINLDNGDGGSDYIFKIDMLNAASVFNDSYVGITDSVWNVTLGGNAFTAIDTFRCFEGLLFGVIMHDHALTEPELDTLHSSVLDILPTPYLSGSPFSASTPKAGGSKLVTISIVNSAGPGAHGPLSLILQVVDPATGDLVGAPQPAILSGNGNAVVVIPSRVGYFEVVASVNPAFPPAAFVYKPNGTITGMHAIFDSLPLTKTTPENAPFTFTLIGAAPSGDLVIDASTTCAGPLAWARTSATEFEVTLPPQDYEAASTCSVFVQHHTMPNIQELTIAITDVNDLPTAADAQLVFKSEAQYASGVVDFALPGADVDAGSVLVYSITSLPAIAAIALPGTTTPLDEEDLPVVLPGSVAPIFLKRGIYNDSFTWAVDSSGDGAAARVRLLIDVPCDNGRTPTNDDGTCICPSGFFVNITDGCESCREGTFYTYQAVADPCDPCPVGGYCAGGLTVPVPDNGFGYGDDKANSTNFVPCRPPAVCVRGGNCRAGSIGFLCSDCVPGFYKDKGLCEPCPSTAPILLTVLFLLMVALAVLLVKLARKSAAYFTGMAVGFNFVQVLAIIGEFDLKWPGFVQATFRALSVFAFNINVFQPECAFAGGAVDYFPIWLFKLSIPFMFLVLFGGFLICLTLYKRVRASISEVQHPWLAKLPLVTRATAVLLRNASINAFVTVLMMCYLVLLSVTFEVFDCVSGAMVKAPDVVCGSREWRKYLAVGLSAMVLYGIGIPLLFSTILYWHRLSLFQELTIVKFGLLYRRYRPQWYGWEVIILARKLGVVVGILVFNSVLPQALIALFSLIGGLIAQILVKPYLTTRVNNLEIIHLACSAFVVACGLILFGTSKSGDEAGTTFVGVLVVLVIAANVCFIGLVVFLELRYQYRRIQRGVQAGFASDEVVLDERFFKLGFRVRHHERNLLGTVSSLALSSAPGIQLRAELCDGNGALLSAFDGRSTTMVQTDGTLHNIVSVFTRVGRFQLKIFAWSLDEEMYLANSVYDEHKIASTASTPDLLNEAQPMPAATAQADSRSLLDVLTCQERSTIRKPIMSYHMNCDAPPQAVVQFALRSPRMVDESGVVLYPRFYELSRFIPHQFSIRVPHAVGLVVAASEPRLLSDGVELQRNDDDGGIFSGSVAFTDPGPVHVWGQYLVPAAQVGENELPCTFAKLVSYEVLEGRVGWEDIDNEDARIIDRLCEGNNVEMHAVLEADLSTTDPPILAELFHAKRGLLYLPKTQSLPFASGGVHLELRLPSAVDIRLAVERPTTDADGVPFFRRADGVQIADATWEQLGGVQSGTAVCVWAAFADLVGYADSPSPRAPEPPAWALPSSKAPTLRKTRCWRRRSTRPHLRLQMRLPPCSRPRRSPRRAPGTPRRKSLAHPSPKFPAMSR
ncbi:uncharacterized protein AMSG_04320 [Thecamonas trahens ATCC 50062]|uniref:Cadherin domain-containing protein n=1 Tax=Thecamonas trahens ATCC 50062 TaxID=461836 RepID=A0A0L0D7D1_THETB|nr:hypothetical protein AMSG_04320 [Thecamonas trahens ATCC 50062]KNC48090.1 hypothetical protein AMSG_04320 [Thecamonas trahens ATCC 50062]|eukprot:XP_013759103.1 hypothetical protein AMSG_04320 [Thecamonas trahens ATCC 50062]